MSAAGQEAVLQLLLGALVHTANDHDDVPMIQMHKGLCPSGAVILVGEDVWGALTKTAMTDAAQLAPGAKPN